MKIVLAILLVVSAAYISYQKAEIRNQKEIIKGWADEARALRYTTWEKLPRGINEYRLDTVFDFWDGKEKNIVLGKQTFKVK